MGDIKLKKVTTFRGYAFYSGKDEQGKRVYSVGLTTCKPPIEGLYNANHLCALMGLPNLFERLTK